MLPITLDLLQTVAFAGIILFLGYGIRRLVPVLARLNIPAPVVGGLPVAGVLAILYFQDIQPIKFDTTLQVPFQNTFFASIGFAASLALLKRGGPLVALFLALSIVVVVLQNVLGAAVAQALGQHPLLGVLAGSVTMAGGPATALAFAPLFEAAGVPGAATLAVAAAIAGIVAGGVVGGPIATFLLGRPLRGSGPQRPGATTLENLAEEQVPSPPPAAPRGEDVEAYILMKHLVLLVVAVGVGVVVSRWLSTWMTLPGYIGSMLVAALIRNIDDMTGIFRLSMRVIDDVGNIALALFLVMALMTLRLWELAGLALPLLVILAAQVAMVAVIAALVVPRLMGRDYDAAVMAGGFAGFMLGTSANAMANMG
ncbi:MAG: sodium/glutamate symporter, partial [Acidimicrobiia bacterium]|nr:sodium/glutamate symporter [Acidimicrobiia bacterium]